jgi:hypothetical protein
MRALRVASRLFRPTIETVAFLLAFGFLGIVLNVLWTLDHQQSRRSGISWRSKYDAEGRSATDDDVDYAPRVRVRREKVDQFMRERKQILQEMERIKQEYEEYDDVDDDNRGKVNDNEANVENIRNESSRLTFRQMAPHVGAHSTDSRDLALGVPNRMRVDRPGEDANQNWRNLGDKKSSNNTADGVRLGARERQQQLKRKLSVDKRRSSFSKPDSLHRRDGDVNSSADAARHRWCTVYNTTPEVIGNEFEFDCIRLRIKPPTTICLYADDDDIHVSRHLREDGLWEPHEVRLFQNLLFQNPDLDVIDIGSQIGQYSLLAASMGRRVVAVEPLPSSIRRLHKAIKIGHFEDKVCDRRRM